MLRLKLPILYTTEKSDRKEDLGLKTNKEDFIYRDVIFYRIDAVGDYSEDGISTGGSLINSGGELYVCSLSKEEVDELIMNYLNGQMI